VIFAGVFAVLLAATVRYFALSYGATLSALASCGATWMFYPRVRTVREQLTTRSFLSDLSQIGLVFGIGLLCLAMLAAGTVFWIVTGFDLPNEGYLERRFHRQQAEFKRIVEMMDRDRSMAIITPERLARGNAYDELHWPRSKSEWGISEERWNEYRVLFKSIGVDAVLRREPDNSITLNVWDNVFINGTHVSYIYCGSHDFAKSSAVLRWPCVEQKESGSGQDREYAYRYKKIAPDWYILQVSY
jgi:hypothetical protein